MKKLFFLFLLIPTFIFSQGWEKVIDEGEGKSVQQTFEGGYIIVGNTNNYDIGSGDVYLIKTDENGIVLWTKNYGGDYWNGGYSVKQTFDGGYIITGRTAIGDGDRQAYTIRTDQNGDTLWTKKYGGDLFNVSYSIQQTSDSGFVIGGYAKSYDDYWCSMNIIKTNHLGETQWSKTYQKYTYTYGFSVLQTNDLGYICVGNTRKGIEEDDVYLVKTDVHGDTIWTRTFGGIKSDVGKSLDQTTDGGYIITGRTNSYGDENGDVLIIKTNHEGIVSWTKSYGGVKRDVGNSIHQTIDGGYIIAGQTESIGSENSDLYIIKTNKLGDSLWTRTYGGSDWDVGESIQQTNEGGYIVVGSTGSYGNEEGDVFLIKTDHNGNITASSIMELPNANPNRKLIKTVDMQGKEIKPRENIPYIEVYDDGTTIKKLIVK